MSRSRLELNVILNAVDKITRPLRAAQTASGQLTNKIKQTRDTLKKLNEQAGKIDGFRKTKTELLSVGQQLDKAKANLTALHQKLKDKTPTMAQAQALRAASREVNALSEKYNQLRLTNARQREELTRSGIATRNLGTAQRTLKGNIASTTAELQKQQAQLTRTAEQQRRLNNAKDSYHKTMHNRAMIAGNGYAAYAAGRQMARLGIRGLSVGYEFDAMMSQTQAVTRIHDKQDPRMQALREQARTLPLSSKYTDSEVASGQFYLARTGYTAESVLAAMPAMLDLATAGNLDLGQTADIASNIQTAMQIPADKMDHVADVLTALFTRNNVDIPMLGESLKYSVGVGHVFGQSLETVAASTALLGSAGIQGSMAGTSMRAILLRVGNSSEVSALGVKTADKNGNMRDLVDIMAEIDAATAHMGNLQRTALFNKIAGRTAVTGFSVLMNATRTGEFRRMRGEPDQYKGEAKQVAAVMMANLKGDATIIHAGLENISVELFEKNNDWLRAGAKQFSDILHTIAEFLKQNPKVSKGIVMVGIAIVGVMTIVGGLMIAIVGLLAPLALLKLTLSIVGIKGFGAFSLLASGVKLVGKAMLFLARAAMANPIIAAIVLIAAGAYLIYKNWDWLKENLPKIWGDIKNKASALFEKLKKTCLDAGQRIADWYKNWPLKKAIEKKWHEIVNDAKQLYEDFLALGRGIIDSILNGINEKYGELKAKILSLTNGLPDSVKSFIGIETAPPDINQQGADINNNTLAMLSGIKTGNPLSNYQPVQTQRAVNHISDNSKTEYKINVTGGAGDIITTVKKAIADAEREKQQRQRSLLLDTQ